MADVPTSKETEKPSYSKTPSIESILARDKSDQSQPSDDDYVLNLIETIEIPTQNKKPKLPLDSLKEPKVEKPALPAIQLPSTERASRRMSSTASDLASFLTEVPPKVPLPPNIKLPPGVPFPPLPPPIPPEHQRNMDRPKDKWERGPERTHNHPREQQYNPSDERFPLRKEQHPVLEEREQSRHGECNERVSDPRANQAASNRIPQQLREDSHFPNNPPTSKPFRNERFPIQNQRAHQEPPPNFQPHRAPDFQQRSNEREHFQPNPQHQTEQLPRQHNQPFTPRPNNQAMGRPPFNEHFEQNRPPANRMQTQQNFNHRQPPPNIRPPFFRGFPDQGPRFPGPPPPMPRGPAPSTTGNRFGQPADNFFHNNNELPFDGNRNDNYGHPGNPHFRPQQQHRPRFHGNNNKRRRGQNYR